MNVLIIGGGGREHALGWKLKRAKGTGKIHFAPGNGGTAQVGHNHPELAFDRYDTRAVDGLDRFCKDHKIGLVVIGPEQPLAEGLADRLQRPDRFVFGPGQDAARLESDKAFAKQMMRAASVPTAEHRTFQNYEAALAYVQGQDRPLVVKAAGLAAGKGVTVCDSPAEAQDALERMMLGKAFGEAGQTVLIEERLQGQEVSVLALVDGQNLYVLDPAQDHKQLHEGDTGPNTGGMGAYSPTPVVSDKQMHEIQRLVLVPIVDVLRRSEIRFQGVLYAGLMLTPAGPKVLEFNVRFGDPECQPTVMRLKGNLLDILLATTQGKLNEVDLSWDQRVCCCVVMCSGGYPGEYRKGLEIQGIQTAESDPEVRVFHAGTKRLEDGRLVTAGGRVLNVCGLGATLAEAQAKANAACEQIRFEGAHWRRDIGGRVLGEQAGKR